MSDQRRPVWITPDTIGKLRGLANFAAVEQIITAWDAAEPCPKCNGTGLVPSLEGCGTRVQCRACHGTGHAS